MVIGCSKARTHIQNNKMIMRNNKVLSLSISLSFSLTISLTFAKKKNNKLLGVGHSQKETDRERELKKES